MRMSKYLMGAMFVAATIAAQPASAVIINSLPGGVAQVMPAENYFGTGPKTFDDITWTAVNGSSVYGYTGGYGYNDNGSWSGTPMIGTNSPADAMNLVFTLPVGGFLADINWAVFTGSPYADAYLRAYDSSNNLLDSIQFSSGASNLQAPGYWGFIEAPGSIARIELVGAYIGARNITISDLAGGVPEPATWGLMILGFAGLGGALRRQKTRAVA